MCPHSCRILPGQPQSCRSILLAALFGSDIRQPLVIGHPSAEDCTRTTHGSWQSRRSCGFPRLGGLQRAPQSLVRVVHHRLKRGVPTRPNIACGRAIETTLPFSSSQTHTLHGSSRQMPSFASSARCASCGLQAPRINYLRNCRSSLALSVDWTSISVRIPNHSCFSASVTRARASSNGAPRRWAV